jgi:hypothetical protein
MKRSGEGAEQSAPVEHPEGGVPADTAEGAVFANRGRTSERFRRQHEDLAILAKELVKRLDTRVLGVDPSSARQTLAAFSGRLRVHAAMEQGALYPSLFAAADETVAKKAHELFSEVGTLYDEFFGFMGRWPDNAAVRADPEAFSRETMAILFRLGQRMRRENEELFPLVDALDPHASGTRQRP